VRHGETGFLFEFGRWDEAARHLLFLADSAERRQRMGLLGRDYTEAEFSLQKMVAGYEACYRILGQQGRRIRVAPVG
jgi:hypothetical protein